MRWAVFWLLIVAVVLVPFFLFEERFNAVAARIQGGGLTTISAAALIAALLAADIALPVPSSLVSTAAGVLLGFWFGAAVCWFGMTTGCLIGYVLGSRAARGPAATLVGQNELVRAESIARRYGDWTLVLTRAVPVLAEASVIVAGIARMPFSRFFLVTALSNLGISAAYSAVGAYSMCVESFLLAFVGAMAIPAAAGLALRRFERK